MRSFAQSIVETVREPLLVLDAELRVREASASFYRTFQVSQEETVDRLLYELGEGQWNTLPLRKLLDELNTTGQAFIDVEVQHEFPRIGHRTMLLNARRVYGDDDCTPRILLAIGDVTEKQAAQEELKRLKVELEHRVRERTSQLEASIRELEAFCYSVSHDLRAPLRAIDGFSLELLTSYRTQLDDRGRHYLDRIRAGSQRMAQLIDDLLQLSRLSRSDLQLQEVDLSAMALEVAEELRQQEPDRDVAFFIEPRVIGHGDARQLRVILDNLLGNAWKFTGKHPNATIAFGQAECEDGPAYYVRDDGAGFDMAESDKLFGVFQRLHTERDYAGTGIGLATVQRLIHRHGGRVWAQGAVDRGAVFSFTLPIQPESNTTVRSSSRDGGQFLHDGSKDG